MAARKNRKTGRFQKTTRRRRRKPKVNLLNVAQTVVLSNILTENAFGLNLVDFITSDEKSAYGGKTSASRITLKELATRGWKKHYGVSENEYQLAWNNIKKNWMGLAGGFIGVPIAFQVGKKLLRKQILNPLNRGLKMTGLDVKV